MKKILACSSFKNLGTQYVLDRVKEETQYSKKPVLTAPSTEKGNAEEPTTSTRLQVVRDRIVARQNAERGERETRREKYLGNHHKVLAFLKEHIPELGDGDTGEISPLGLHETTFYIKDKFDGCAVLYVITSYDSVDDKEWTIGQLAWRDSACERLGDEYSLHDIIYRPWPEDGSRVLPENVNKLMLRLAYCQERGRGVI